MVACDNKILMQDLASSATREIPRSVLESKAPTCLAVLYNVGSQLLSGGFMNAKPHWTKCDFAINVRETTALQGLEMCNV